MNWFLRGMASIGEGMASLTLCPEPIEYKRKILTDEEAMKADADAIRKDFEAVLGKW